MKNILVLAGSNNLNSINKKFAIFAGSQIEGIEKSILDLNDFEMPIYSPDREEKSGVPQLAKDFLNEINASDGIILSLAEYNGSYSAAFKNILDWSSRHKQKLWSEKPILLLSTSPGGRGGSTVLEAAKNSFPHLGAKVVANFSLPSFFDNFDQNEGIKDNELKTKFKKAMDTFRSSF